MIEAIAGTVPSQARVSCAGNPRLPARRVGSAELLGERGELVIEHLGREYRLRVTQNGKLILTA